MYLIEFFADKVPYVDNGWDVLHTFIRVPAGAILAARLATSIRHWNWPRFWQADQSPSPPTAPRWPRG